jgi:hypothetical protein
MPIYFELFLKIQFQLMFGAPKRTNTPPRSREKVEWSPFKPKNWAQRDLLIEHHKRLIRNELKYLELERKSERRINSIKGKGSRKEDSTSGVRKEDLAEALKYIEWKHDLITEIVEKKILTTVALNSFLREKRISAIGQGMDETAIDIITKSIQDLY